MGKINETGNRKQVMWEVGRKSHLGGCSKQGTEVSSVPFVNWQVLYAKLEILFYKFSAPLLFFDRGLT
jgi:hypothetical protein